MSFPENDRKVRSKKGKTFPGSGGYGGPPFVATIAEALKVDFGASPSSVKHIARLTRTNERAARNWFEGKNGPSGENLVCLMRHSDAVFWAVLTLSERDERVDQAALIGIRQQLAGALATIDAMYPLGPDAAGG